METINKKTYTALLLIIILVFIINIMSFKNGHNWGDDFAEYISVTKSIVEGTIDEFMSAYRYRLENSTRWIGSGIYWGLSFLLSPIYYFFGLDIYIMKIYINLFFLLSLFIVFLLFQDKLKNLQNLLLIAIIGFNPYFFEFKDNILTDIPYLFFSLLTVFLIKRFVFLRKTWINNFISYSCIGLIMFLSYFIRPIGYVLLPTLLFAQYFQSRSSSKSIKSFMFKEKYKFIPYITFFSLWFLSSLILPGDAISGHGELILGNSISKIIVNIKYYLIGFANFFPYFSVKYSVFGLGYDKIHLILYIVILSIVVLGVTKNVKDDYLYIFYILFNLIILIIFPGRDKRFLMPLFPFFIYFLLQGFSRIYLSFELSKKYKFKAVNAVYIFAIGLMLVSLARVSFLTYKNIIFNKTEVIEGPYSPDSIEMFNYIKENTNEDDAIIFYKPRAMFLYTDRKSFAMSHFSITPEQAFDSDAQYVAISKKKYTDYDIRFEDFLGKLDCEFENNSFFLCNLKKTSHH